MFPESKIVYVPEAQPGRSYREIIQDETRGSGIWDYLEYDNEGYLRFKWEGGSKRIVELVDERGRALEVVNSEIALRRCHDFERLTTDAAEKVGYEGGFAYYYATKANMTARIVLSAVKAGWGIETSSPQDFINLRWLFENGLADSTLPIISNGFKSPRYTGEIVESVGNSLNVTPIVDNLDELRTYLTRGEGAPVMEVGLRMKFGRVENDAQLSALVSQFGMSWDEISEAARRIEGSSLRLTTLHAMVAAAHETPIDGFVDSILFAGRKYFELKKIHPSLSTLDIGGGIPPLSEPYNHAELLEKLLKGLKEEALEYGMPAPKLAFEMGSFVSSEAAFNIFKVIGRKTNNVDLSGRKENWVFVNGGLMATIPDMLITGRRFVVLAANGVNKEARLVRVGDLTCDSDGRLPGEIFLPDGAEPLFIVILGTGNYQDQLAGDMDVHHCAIGRPREIVHHGGVWETELPREEEQAVREALGYSVSNLARLREDFRGAGRSS